MISPERLRRLDRWLGLPACWLAAGWLRLRQWRSPSREARGASSTLVIQLSESGSMVLADPAIRALRHGVDDAPFCVTFERNAPALAITGTIPPERVFAIRTDHVWRLPLEAWRFLRWARRHRVRTVVDLELFSRMSALLGVLSGARERIGFHAPGMVHTRLYSRGVTYDSECHIAVNYLRLAEALGAECGLAYTCDLRQEDGLPPLAPRRTITPAERDRVDRVLSQRLPSGSYRLVLVNANASDLLPQRRWPRAHYVALIRGLLARHPDIAVVLIGAAEDRPTTAGIAAAIGEPRCADTAGCFTLGDLPALFARASAMVSNDSGPAHFAAVTPLPTVVLFGPESPHRYRPLGNARVITADLGCSPCVDAITQRRTACRDNQCMKRISVAEVLDAVETELAQSAARIDVVPL